LELIDVNNDGILDIYIVQKDENSKYCSTSTGGEVVDFWGNGVAPPNGWQAPNDKANDIVLLGKAVVAGGERIGTTFTPIRMQHRLPGCGYKVEKFTPRKLVLAQGDPSHPGTQVLLEWD